MYGLDHTRSTAPQEKSVRFILFEKKTIEPARCVSLMKVFLLSVVSPPIFFEILMNGAGTVTGIARYRTGACITGTTAGQIPILPNTYRSSKNAKNDIFVVCVDGSGNVIFSTYYGGDNADQGNSVIVNGTTVIVSGGVRALSIADGASVSSASPGVGLRAVTAMFDIVTGERINEM